jgi:hypothetical protein
MATTSMPVEDNKNLKDSKIRRNEAFQQKQSPKQPLCISLESKSMDPRWTMKNINARLSPNLALPNTGIFQTVIPEHVLDTN